MHIREEIALITINELIIKYRKQPNPICIDITLKRLKAMDPVKADLPAILKEQLKGDKPGLTIAMTFHVIAELLRYHGVDFDNVSPHEMTYVTAQVMRIPELMQHWSPRDPDAAFEALKRTLNVAKGIA